MRVEPEMPVMDMIDRLLGPLDEKMISRLLGDWREQVWQNAIHLLQMQDAEQRSEYVRQVEVEALRLGRLIG